MSTCRKPERADDVANVRHPVNFAPVDADLDRPTWHGLHQGDRAGDAGGRVAREPRRGSGRADLGDRQ
jgi:hypothetical protein